MQKIVPHLWFDTQAVEAAEFYASVFPDSKVTHRSVLHDTPSGDAGVVGFRIMGFDFMAISAGPYFTINPSISIMVNFDPSRMPDAREKIDEIWGKLLDGGKALMPIDKYPFSERYGWVQDKYGFTWQLILTDPAGEERPVMVPTMLFVNDMCGKAEEATDFYLSVFSGAKRGALMHYPPNSEPNKEGSVMFTDFTLEGQWFAAMDGGGTHEFKFNEAVSLLVQCDDQAEIDRYWNALSAVPEAEQCGWLKDKYGVSWQIAPANMNEMMKGDPAAVARVTKAFLAMKKFDLAALKDAYEGK
jgi:predicted 3-demethylubiquinone-9 3-methyltransferase (glyoxalase superfamily)